MILMLYICSSMYLEAEPFIKKLNLKKDINHTKFQVFKNDKVTLLICGVGKIKSAIALTYLLSKSTLSSADLLINIGICGCRDTTIPLGSLFLCNKIIDNDTKHTFYPDILFKHNFNESSIETTSLLNKNPKYFSSKLIDMESSSIYEAASTFLQPHQIMFIKIVSDYLDTTTVTKDFISKLIFSHSTEIIKRTNFLVQNFNSNKDIFTPKDIDTYNEICENLNFSVSMKNTFKHLLTYEKLLGKDISKLLTKYKEIECNSKNEGKMYFEKIKSELI